jgi:glycosyltransferase involved in cell wall biosynthesis
VLACLGPWVERVRVCPEADAGLPTPRVPVTLTEGPGGPRVTTASGLDVTDRLAAFARERATACREAGIAGFVCKARSPSCAVAGSPGLFTRALAAALPGIPIEDEEGLREPFRREAFLGRVLARAEGTTPPAVSVVMPVRDAEATIDEALASVLGQTLRDLEVVVVDDGSTDRTPALLDTWAARDDRVRPSRGPARGIVAALNDGLAAARAPLVARMDADDVALPGRLEAQVAYLAARPDVAVAGCLVECFPRHALTAGMRHYEAWLNSVVEPEDVARELFVESPMPHPGVMFRRDAVLAAGGYRDGPFPEDYDLWLRLHAEGRRLGKVREVLLRWRDGGRRLSRTDTRYSPDSFRRLKALHLDAFLRGRREVQLCGAGPDAKAWGRVLGEAGIRVLRYFDVDRRKIGGRIGGKAPVLDWREAGRHRDVPMLCAVGVKGVRPDIRRDLAAFGFVEGTDFVFVQ